MGGGEGPGGGGLVGEGAGVSEFSSPMNKKKTNNKKNSWGGSGGRGARVSDFLTKNPNLIFFFFGGGGGGGGEGRRMLGDRGV